MSVEMTLTYRGDLRCELRHGPSGTCIESDAPADNHGRATAFSPTDLVGAALASCAITTMMIKAPQHDIVLDAAQATLTKTMTSEGDRRIAGLELNIELPARLSIVEREALQQIARECPVALSISPEVDLVMRFHYELE